MATKKKKNTAKETKNTRAKKDEKSLLSKLKFHYYKTRQYASFDLKVPRLLIFKFIILLLIIISGAFIVFLVSGAGNIELQSSDTCNISNIPEANLELFNKFNIKNDTTFEDFEARFEKLKKDIPGLTKYYGPNLNKNNAKTGAGVHFSRYSVVSFILIWDEPFYSGYILPNGVNESTAEQDRLVEYIPSNQTGKLQYIWLYNETGQLVCKKAL